VERTGPDTDAYVRLPPATLDSRMSEIVAQQLALTDYRLKLQAQGVRKVLASIQEVRTGMREGRHKSGS
jgi:hypothetical protein